MPVLLGLVLAAATLASVSPAAAQQPGGIFGDHYYEAIEEPATWHNAAAYCEQDGGYLVTINSAEENQFVYNLAADTGGVEVWLGATDEAVEGTWEWVTSEPFDYTNWGPGEPNNYAAGPDPTLGEDYLTFHGAGAYDPPLPGVWNDWQYEDDGSESTLLFVCEYEPTTYNDTRAGLTLDGLFIHENGVCGEYPMYLPGGSVEAVVAISNDNIRRPLAFAFNVEMYELTSEGSLGESLGLFFADQTVPAGGQVQVPISFSVPTDAEGLHELQVRLYATPDRARPSGQSKVPAFVQLDMVFCTPGA
jgi:hypothetical protein